MTKMPLAICRCDASAHVGGGHLVRTMALAGALEHDGWRVVFAVSDDTLVALPLLAATDHQLVTGFNGGASDVKRLTDQWSGGCDLLVIDHYGWDATLERDLSGWAAVRLVIDDLANRPHDCEVLVDSTLGRRTNAYENLVPADCLVLAGAQFAPLRPDFAIQRHQLAQSEPAKSLNRIMVTLGMTDQTNVTGTIIEGLLAADFAGQLDIVLGPFAPHLSQVRKLMDMSKAEARLHIGLEAPAMVALMAAADLVIGAAGTSSYERCCLGIPVLVVDLADNQRDNVSAIVQSGAAHSLGPVRELSPAGVAAALRRLVSEPEMIATMRIAALAQCDGRGTARIAMALRPEHIRDGTLVNLRPATAEDAKLIHRWQQQPSTRRFARNPQVPDWNEHVAWMTNKLTDPGCLFNIVLLENEPAGIVRLDKSPPTSGEAIAFEISIFMAAEVHGRGVGLAALKLARRLVPEAEIQAVVLPENLASVRLFEKADYTLYKDIFRYLPITGLSDADQRTVSER